MQRQRIGPAPTEPDGDGLPVLDGLAEQVAAAAHRTGPEPAGGGPALLAAARGYFSRRGLPAETDHLAAAPGGQPLLLALLSAIGGDVLLPRPCASWHEPPARLAGLPVHHAPVPAECGGVPDPFALLETVRRIREEGGAPRVVLLSVADDPTGTVPPPELLREVCEAAVGAGLLIVSDETWRDTAHDPHERVLLSPAQMWPRDVVVLADLAGALLPPCWPAAVARFPADPRGTELRARVLSTLAAVRAVLPPPVAAAAAHALAEPEPVRARTVAAARAYGTVTAAAHHMLTSAGVLCRPPSAGRHLYADLDELRGGLAARGITDPEALERHLADRLGRAARGGHRFGDPSPALRVRLSALPLLGPDEAARLRALDAPDPLVLPYVAEALADLAAAFDVPAAGRPGRPPG